MKRTYQATFEHTAHLTDQWVQQVNDEIQWNDLDRSFNLLRATLHAIRDTLSVDEAVQFAAQLPILLKGFYYADWNPTEQLRSEHNKSTFVGRVCRNYSAAPLEHPEEAISVVLSVLTSRISSGQLSDERALRKRLREFWPSPMNA